MCTKPERTSTYTRCNPVFIPDLRSKHVTYSFFIAKMHLVPFLYEIEGCVSDEFETYSPTLDGVQTAMVRYYEPVKHSANLNPSAAAIASTILELTVDATIASLPINTVSINRQRIHLANGPIGFPDALYFCKTALAKSAPS